MRLCPMTHTRAVALMAISLAFIPHAQGDGPGVNSWTRLQNLPLSRREELAAKLREFGSLPRDRQLAVRELDGKIASLDAADRDRFLALIRHYHVWLREQPEAIRTASVEGATEDRIRTIAQSLAKSRPSAAARGSGAPIEPSYLLGRSPFDLAYLIKTWQALTDEQQKQVESPKGGAGIAARARKLADLGKQLNIEVEARPAEETERLRRRASDAIFLREFTNGARFDRILEKAAEKQAASGKVARPILKNLLGHLADAFWLAEHQRQPMQVNEANLRRFEDSIPEWLRISFDSLPPAEARLRMSRIYRLAYPSPSEMPITKVPAKGPLITVPVAPRSPDGVAF
ncbi:hypothetical protein EP7_004006 [Isosphaeraceae bacterium EP7]